jgi:hypothetical protein
MVGMLHKYKSTLYMYTIYIIPSALLPMLGVDVKPLQSCQQSHVYLCKFAVAQSSSMPQHLRTVQTIIKAPQAFDYGMDQCVRYTNCPSFIMIKQ